MKLTTRDAIFVTAWMVSRTLTEVVHRMAGHMPRAEARRLAADLRARGADIPTAPAGLGRDGPVVLTRHPDDDECRLDAGGWVATRTAGAIEVAADFLWEGPWPCRCCDRASFAGWSLVHVQDQEVRHEFACDGCVTLSG
jgi:hypothetical protein